MAWLRRPEPEPAAVKVELPPELADPDAPLWFDTVAYLAYMRQRRWWLPVRDRVHAVDPPLPGDMEPADVPVRPVRARERRWAAAEGWALDHRVALDDAGRVDLNRLRALLN